MIKIILFTLILSSNVSAIDFQKVTGTFEVDATQTVPVGEATLAQAALGTFDITEDTPRSPASVTEEQPHVTEITGSFNK